MAWDRHFFFGEGSAHVPFSPMVVLARGRYGCGTFGMGRFQLDGHYDSGMFWHGDISTQGPYGTGTSWPKQPW